VKKTSFFTSLFLIFPIIAILGVFIWWKIGLSAIDQTKKEKVSFVITKGQGLSEISAKLKEQNLIKDPLLFKVLVFLNKNAKNIQAGNFYLSPSMPATEIASILTRGTNDRRITIIEGLRQEQIAQLLIGQEFNVSVGEWQKEIESQGLEGKLFPDTYFFPDKASQSAILKIIDKNFQKKVIDGLKAEIQKSKLSLSEILILSSIVEREARADEDRRLVAGILLKRWQQNWPLQADATIQYSVSSAKFKVQSSKFQNQDLEFDWWPKNLYQKDLKIKSVYNTYLNFGLPPTPICNPGLSAIKAVLNPQNSTYWFYLSDSEGKIHYADSSEEHAQNIQNYLLGE